MRECSNGRNSMYRGDILNNITDVRDVVRWMFHEVDSLLYIHEKTINGLILDAKQRFPNCSASEDELYEEFSRAWNRIYNLKERECK